MSKVKAKIEGKAERGWIKEDGVVAKYYSDNEPSLFDNKVALAVEGLHPYFEKMLRERISKENALVISEYINALRREINLSIGHRNNLDNKELF